MVLSRNNFFLKSATRFVKLMMAESEALPGMINNLVIVCCHAIYLGGPSNGLDESEW